MPTSTGHTKAIRASKVNGTAVYNTAGERIGHVEDVVLDKLSNHILFAVLGFGGFLGIGEKFHAVPWSLLDYQKDKGGYVVSLSKEILTNAPAYTLADLVKDDGAQADIRGQAHDYYKVPRYWNDMERV